MISILLGWSFIKTVKNNPSPNNVLKMRLYWNRTSVLIKTKINSLGTILNFLDLVTKISIPSAQKRNLPFTTSNTVWIVNATC